MSKRKKSMREKVWWTGEKKENLLLWGFKNLQGSEAPYSSIKDLITLDDFPFSTNLIPQLTAVDIDMYDMGYQAGELLIMKIKKKQYLIQSHITLPEIIERKST